MAVVDNGVKVSVPEILIPSGAAAQAVTEFTDFKYTRDLTLSVTKVSVDSSLKSDTFDDIIDEATIGIKKQVLDLITADFDDTANTVTYYTEYLTLKNNQGVSVDTEFYTDTAESYTCTVKVFIKTS